MSSSRKNSMAATSGAHASDRIAYRQASRLGMMMLAAVTTVGCTFNGKPLFGAKDASAGTSLPKGTPASASAPTPAAGGGPALAAGSVSSDGVPSWCALSTSSLMKAGKNFEERRKHVAQGALDAEYNEMVGVACNPKEVASGNSKAALKAIDQWRATNLLADFDMPAIIEWQRSSTRKIGKLQGFGDVYGENTFKVDRALVEGDALQQLTQVTLCASAYGDRDFREEADALGATIAYATCRPAVLAVRAPAVVAAIDGQTGISQHERMSLRHVSGHQLQALARAEARWAKYSATDSAFASVAAIVDEAYKAWKPASRRATLAKQLFALVDAKESDRRSAWGDCQAATEKALATAIKAHAGEYVVSKDDTVTTSPLKAVVSHPEGWLAAKAYTLCARNLDPEDQRVMALWLTNPVRDGAFSGPVSESRMALRAGWDKLRFDVKAVSPSYLTVDDPLDIFVEPRQAYGEIAKIDKEGATWKLSFKLTAYKARVCTKYHSTNRISRITSDGRVEYETYCTKLETIDIERGPDPVRIPATRGAGVAVGRHFFGIREANGATSMPLSIAASATASKAISVLGVEL